MMESLKNRRRAAGEGGFTLIELLVVIVILGILAGVVVFAVSGINDKGEDAACQTDTRTLRTAMEANYAQHNNYVVTPANWDGTGTATRTPVPESALVSAGFLSTESTLHDVFVFDRDGSADIGAGVEIRVAAGGVPQCGPTEGGVAGQGGNL
jgi:prepilin-type N-terminal cleavage/methylation domain-containing protein